MHNVNKKNLVTYVLDHMCKKPKFNRKKCSKQLHLRKRKSDQFGVG